MTQNIGDLVCAPYLYFPDLLGNSSADVVGFHQGSQPERQKRIEFHNDFQEADILVYGGGGLLENDFFTIMFDYLSENKKDNQKIILWGAGHNNWELTDWRHMKQSYTFRQDLFDLLGVRDYKNNLNWVPCVSCMSTLLDKPYLIKRDVGIYMHYGTYTNSKYKNLLPQGFEYLHNSSPMNEVIDFLGETELILTDSFHGAYWATILGRKVVAFPTSSKFYSFKHSVPLCNPEDWKIYSRLSQVYPEAKSECRQANIDFANLVRDFIS